MEEKTIRAVVCHTPGLISIGDSTALDAFSGQEIEITIRPVPKPKRRWYKVEVRKLRIGDHFLSDYQYVEMVCSEVHVGSLRPVILETGEEEVRA